MEQIAARGYATISAVREMMAGKSLIHRRIERVLPGILARNDLTKITANAELKKQLDIKAKGFPKVILKDAPAAADGSTKRHFP